ncbi:hypothetical protein E2C01_013370 [Portunus trituberculatus]|uniref:Uncharacterized protein n=1 Tax=Portunus trituberculatus TaxID=210409 RepID=A0A5B7DGG2_PORTR|nr:hypothetical protein [Portunus trituberculatus]
MRGEAVGGVRQWAVGAVLCNTRLAASPSEAAGNHIGLSSFITLHESGTTHAGHTHCTHNALESLFYGDVGLTRIMAINANLLLALILVTCEPWRREGRLRSVPARLKVTGGGDSDAVTAAAVIVTDDRRLGCFLSEIVQNMA